MIGRDDSWKEWPGWIVPGRVGCRGCDYGGNPQAFCWGHAGCHASGVLEDKPIDFSQGCMCAKCVHTVLTMWGQVGQWLGKW